MSAPPSRTERIAAARKGFIRRAVGDGDQVRQLLQEARKGDEQAVQGIRELAHRLRLRAGATARWWGFDGRIAPTAERLERRSITPELDLQYATRPGWLLRGRLQQIFRGSNDPRFAENEQHAVVTAGYRF